MRRQLVPGPVVRLTVIKAKTRPGIEATPHPTIDRSSQLVDVIIEEEYVDQYGEIEDIMDFVFRENSQQANEIDIESDSDEEQSNSVLC